MIRIWTLTLLSISIIACNTTTKQTEWRLSSPEKNVTFKASLNNGSLTYELFRNNDTTQLQVIMPSDLGITLDKYQFKNNLKFISQSQPKLIDETYTMKIGKQLELHQKAQEVTLRFSNDQNALVELIVRAFDNGVAFRYNFPETNQELQTIVDEYSSFRVDTSGTAWMMPYDKATQWTPGYEADYQNSIKIGTSAPTNEGWAFPTLFNNKSGWILISEAGQDTIYCGTRLQQDCSDGNYRVRFPSADEGNSFGAIHPQTTLPYATPWRMIVVSDQLSDIVENNLVYHLSEPCKIADTSWIKPGRVSWSWWSEPESPKNAESLKKYIDLAREMNWEYSLVDANWNIMQKGTIDEVINYGNQQKIGIWLWYNSGGPNNTVTEQPRDLMNNREIRRKEMARLQQLGIKGLKIDFFQSDKPGIMKLYSEILADAADFRLMINFHGCTLPRGLSRTWPNLMSMEAARGAENYAFYPRWKEIAATMHTIYPFTRNSVGPMDYTPVTFTDYSADKPHYTTWTHELALPVIFENGLLHFADRAESYRNQPQQVKNFISTIPVVWHETKLLGGEPGKWVAIARRDGTKWYLAAINGENIDRTIDLPLTFLPEGNFAIEQIKDGAQKRTFQFANSVHSSTDTLTISLIPQGGFVATITSVQP